MLRTIAIWGCMCLAVLPARAQPKASVVLTGKTVNAADQSPLPGVSLFVTPVADSTQPYGAISDAEGLFTVALPAAGDYRLRFSFIGYKTVDRTINISDARTDLGAVRLEQDVVTLQQALVKGTQERVVVKNDTVEYNAGAYKVNPDASAEDLVSKMPGIVVQDGTVQAHGEDVQRVLVDGEEFFGDDATLALRNLPAEVIDKVQVIDRLSDQAQFTGYNDGNTEKTINIVTRPGRNNGQFGNVFGGYGTAERYQAGGNMNLFDGTRRISIIGLANNVNQQNFASEDLLGVMGGGGRRGGGGGSGRGGAGGRGGMGGDASNFLVGRQGGINTTNALGLNYSDRWGERIRITGSYFFNNSGNASDIVLGRQYFLSDAESQLYDQTSSAHSQNFNHRANLRLQYELDDANSLIVTPRLGLQTNSSQSLVEGLNTLANGLPLSQTSNDHGSDNTGYTSSANVLFRHQFAKRGRTLSTNLGLGLNNRWGHTDQYSTSLFYDETGKFPDSTQIYDDRIDNDAGGRTLSGNLTYTEPLGEKGQLRLNYSPSYSRNTSDREAFRLDEVSQDYSVPDTALSNAFGNSVISQRGGLSYQLRGEQYSLSAGLNYQDARLMGDQSFPSPFQVDRSFETLLPEARLRIRFSETSNLRLSYRTSTDLPSINQLQNVIDNTNPLFLSTGNPDLRPGYTHSVQARYNTTSVEKGEVFMSYVTLGHSQGRIGTASLLAATDTVLARGIVLPRGGQFSYPVNLDGYWNARSFLTYGRPVGLLKSNLNLHAGLSYSRLPARVNETQSVSSVYDLNGGMVLGSNVSERLDFTASYSLSYDISHNTLHPGLDRSYLRHRTNFRFNWLPWKQLVLNTTLNFSRYTGLDTDNYPSTFLWNAGLGYKIMHGNSGEVKLLVTDILDRNNSIGRAVTERYIEDSTTQTLGRYVMLNFTYTFRNFNVGSPRQRE